MTEIARLVEKLERRFLASAPARPTPLGTPLPEPCRRCGGNRLRLEAGLWVCDRCFPETPGGPEPILDTEVQQAVKLAALGLLNERGVRIMENPAGPERFALGVWRDQDSQELREAILVLGFNRYRIVYLDDPSISEKYRQFRPRRRQPGLFGGDP
ncbi:MAG: TFIIB-type zinc finger domain-containing protein [Acidobacteriota bacterium]